MNTSGLIVDCIPWAGAYNELQEQYTYCFNGTRIPNSSIGVIGNERS